MIRRTFAALLFAGLFHAPAAVHAAAPWAPSLFLPTSATTAKSAGTDRVIAALSADRTTAGLRVVDVASRVVSADAPAITLELAPGRRVIAHRTDGYVNADGTQVWVGSTAGTGVAGGLPARGADHVEDDPMHQVILVRHGDRLAGTLRGDGRLHKLWPLATGGHALVEIDESATPPDHPPGPLPIARGAAEATPRPTAKSGGPRPPVVPGIPVGRRTPGAPAPATGPVVIRAMVVVTAAAVATTGDTTAFVNLAVAETNQGYRNSRINIRMELAGWYQTPYVTANFNTDLDRFTGTADGFMDEFHATRNQVAADINVLIINDPAYQYCGLGWLNANANYAFSVVDYRCATGNYTFGHEVGHNQGAHHDVANGNNTDFVYGHGFQAPAQGWRTVMAYACTSVSCPKINFWSNPKRFYRGVPMGSTGRENNARVLNETAARVAAFR